MAPPVDSAVLFTAVVGSDAGSDAEDAAMAAALDLVGATARTYAGTVVKVVNGELLATFPTADAAVAAALGMREQVLPGDFALGFKAGLHFGPVVAEGGELFGDTVSVAARLSTKARRDQVLASGQAVERLAPGLRARARKVEGIETPRFRLEIYDFPRRMVA